MNKVTMEKETMIDKMEKMSIPALAKLARERSTTVSFWLICGFITGKLSDFEVKKALFDAGTRFDRTSAVLILKQLEQAKGKA